jgi:hypothetical protein
MPQSVFDLAVSNENKEQMTTETPSFLDNFEALVQIASNSKGNIKGTHVSAVFLNLVNKLFSDKLPVGFYEFQSILEKMLGFDQIDSTETENLRTLQNDFQVQNYCPNLRLLKFSLRSCL